MKKMMRAIQWLVVLCGLWWALGGITANAEETIFVEDKAGILAAEDQRYIHDLNETTFKALEGEPQFVVVTLKSLAGDSIENYAEKKFQQLGIGNQELDNGFLFVIAIEDREFRLETGYGVEAVITDGMKEDIVSEEVTDFLRDEQYAQAVMTVTRNVERIVTARYGDYAASVAAIQARQTRNKQIGQVVLLCLAGLGIVILLAILVYVGRKKRIQHRFEEFVSSSLQVRVYRRANASSELSMTGDTRRFKDYQLSKVAATKTIRRGNSGELANDDEYRKTTLATYLIEDAVIAYWLSHRDKLKYELTVYLKEEEIRQLMYAQVTHLFRNPPLKENPLFAKTGRQLIGSYMKRVTAEHQRDIAISERNKAIVKKASKAYILAMQVPFRDGLDEQLMIALMTYFALENRNLADEQAVDNELLSQSSMTQFYAKAKKKRCSIERGYRHQALSDLDQMVIGSYYMQQAMVWSSYSASSNDSGGGSSSFGGGSSGGGGFSGSW